MPVTPPHACPVPGCPTLVPSGQARCDAHERKKQKMRRDTEGNPYNNSRWRALRSAWLQEHPLCAACEKAGRVTAGTVCDHIAPHKGDPVKFWSGPFQTLCATCHSSKTTREDGGFGNVVIR